MMSALMMVGSLCGWCPASAEVPDESPAAAFSVVQRYYAAISARRYRDAYLIWHAGFDYRQVRAGYADTRHVTVTQLRPCMPEGGAGSVYCEIPVRVDAVSIQGRHSRFTGTFTVRRVNDIPGSSEAQRRWHIIAATLHGVSASVPR